MSFTAISSYKGVWNGNYCRPSVSLVEEGKGEGDFGSQCAVSTTKPSSPWNPEGRKGMERCLMKRQLGHWRDSSWTDMALSR